MVPSRERESARESEGKRERARRGREFCLQGTVRDEDQVSANIRGGALGAMMFVPVAPVTVAAKGNGLGVEHRTNALQDADDVYHQRSMAPGTHVAKGNNLGLVLQPCCYLHRPSTALRKPCLFPPETAAAPNTTTQASIIGAGAVLLPAPWSSKALSGRPRPSPMLHQVHRTPRLERNARLKRSSTHDILLVTDGNTAA